MQSSLTPSLHEILGKTNFNGSTTREYKHKKQRNRLLRLTIGEWFNTLVLCIIYFGILYAYSKKETISVPQRRVFNALTTGNSLLLGVNLAASLRSYAKLLRWRMLAICYRPLETFDLVMGCDSLMNVIKLLWKARNHKYKWLPSRTQILCALWLFVHLAITILVGIIGLNYNLDTSNDFVLLKKGSISIVDLNALSTGDYLSDLSGVQSWGVRGAVSDALDWDDDLEFTNSYFSTFDGQTLYYFQDQSASDPTQVGVTARYIETNAYCTAYSVQQGQYGNLSYIVYNDGRKDVNMSLPAAPGPGGLLAISKLNSTCSGTRCVDISIFQAQANSDVDLDSETPSESSNLFICNNTVSQVGSDDAQILTASYLVSDLVARMLAGAIGWSDNPPISNGKEEYAVYTNSSVIQFTGSSSADMANLVSSFTTGAIAFMDDSSGMSRETVGGGEQPIPAQILHVTWRYAGAILAVIPFIHFWTLVAVIAWANKAIIKDDSHLAIAKVYHTLLGHMGDRGCLLRGDELVSVLENPLVAYGWRASAELDGAKHVDVFELGRDGPRMDQLFVEGLYDGASTESTPREGDRAVGPERRRRYRDIDAADYF